MFIDEHRDRFGVEPICRILGVSASAYYHRAGLGAVLDADGFQTLQDGVEQLVADRERVVVSVERLDVGEVEGGGAAAHDGEGAGGTRSRAVIGDLKVSMSANYSDVRVMPMFAARATVCG